MDVLNDVVFGGYCCAIIVCKTGWPDCIDPCCRMNGMCLCCEADAEMLVPVGLEAVTDKRGLDTEKHKVLCQRGTCTCIVPPILSGGPCCKGICKGLCFEERFALPCDDEVPCMCGYCFITCAEGNPKPFQAFPEGTKGKALLVKAPPLAASGGAPSVMERA